MVTKGIIKSIDFNGNTCVVRLPLFEPAGDSEPVEITAIISNTPGSYNGYLVDDVVLVAFEDGLVEQPVVIGKLYLGANIEKNIPRGVVNVTDSSVSEKANIPFDTTLGSSLDEDMPNTQANYKTINEISNELNKTNSNLDNQVRDINNELVGKIDSEKNGTSFGWKVTDSSWSIFQTVNKGTDEEKTTNILYADKDGLKVTGEIEATTGHIGEFVIGQTHDCSEILDENNKSTKQSGIYSEGYISKFEAIPDSKGVYVGTDGIKVGKSFSVNSNGHLTASSFSFEGLGKDSLTYSNINLQDGLKNGNGILMAFGETNSEVNSESYRDGDYGYTSEWYKESYILDLTSANSDDATVKDFTNSRDGNSFAEDSDKSNYKELREVNAFEKSTNTFRLPVRGWGFLQFPTCAQNLSSDSIHVLSFKFRVRPVDTNLFSYADNYLDDWRPSQFVQLVNTLKVFGYVGHKKDAHRYDGRTISYWEPTMWPISFEGTDKLISAVADDDGLGYVINGDVLFDNEKTRKEVGEIHNAIRIENNWINTTSTGFNEIKIVSTKAMGRNTVQHFGNTDREIYYTPVSKQFYAWGRENQSSSLLNPNAADVSHLYFDWFRLTVNGPWVTVKFYFKTPKEIDENMCIQIGYITECYEDEVRQFINTSLDEGDEIHLEKWQPENIWKNEGLSIFEVKEVKIEHNEVATPFNYSLNDRTISSGHGLTAIINAQNKNDAYFEWYNKENSLTGFNSGITVSDYPNSGELGSLIQIVGTSTDTQTNYIITVEVVGVTTELTEQGSRDVYLVNTKSFMRSGAFTSTWIETSTPVHTGSNSSMPITITARSKIGTMLEENSSTSTIKYKWEGDSSYITASANPLVIDQLQNKNLIVELYEGEKLIDTETITYSPLNTPIIDLTNDNATILYDNNTKLGSDVSTTASLYLNGEVVPDTTYIFTATNCTITTNNNTATVTALSANSATVTCTATVNNFNPAYNGKSYTKVFNITKQLKGDAGSDGKTVSIENSFVYALGNNASAAPNNNYSTWSSLILTPTSKNPYVWAVSKRETTVDGISTVTYGTTPFVYQTLDDFVSILSADGVDLIYKTTNNGHDAYHMRADNIVGSIGDKVNIGGVRVDNDTDTPTFEGGWTIKSETKDQQGNVTTPAAIYSNIESMNDTTNQAGVYVGTDGIKLGQNFYVDNEGNVTAKTLRTILSTEIKYGIGYSGTSHEDVDFNSNSPVQTTNDKPFLWTKTKTIYTTQNASNVNDYDESYSVSSSVSVKSTTIEYQNSNDGTKPPSGGNWASSAGPEQGKFTWAKTTITYSDNHTSVSYSVSYTGSNGQPGTSVTIEKTEITYAKHSNSTIAPTTGWVSSPADTGISKGEYLWTKTSVTYSDGKSTESFSVSYMGTDADITKVNGEYICTQLGIPDKATTDVGLYYGVNDAGKKTLFVNADALTAKRLLVQTAKTSTAPEITLLDAGYTNQGAVTIGGFTVGPQALYKDISEFNDTTHQTGVYIGTDGIRLGKNFSVDNEGTVTATGLKIATSQIDDFNNGVKGVIDAPYINTLNITTKKIEVKDGNSTILLADADKPNDTQVGGFKVSTNKLEIGTSGTENYVKLGTDGIGLGTKFSVTNAGELTATGGKIGPVSINESELLVSGAITPYFWVGDADASREAPYRVVSSSIGFGYGGSGGLDHYFGVSGGRIQVDGYDRNESDSSGKPVLKSTYSLPFSYIPKAIFGYNPSFVNSTVRAPLKLCGLSDVDVEDGYTWDSRIFGGTTIICAMITPQGEHSSWTDAQSWVEYSENKSKCTFHHNWTGKQKCSILIFYY